MQLRFLMFVESGKQNMYGGNDAEKGTKLGYQEVHQGMYFYRASLIGCSHGGRVAGIKDGP